MDKLKALVAAKRKATEDEFQGKKFLKRSEIEDLRIKKLRDEEEHERLEKEAKRKQQEQAVARSDAARPTSRASGRARPDSRVADSNDAPQELTKEQVIRRLRRLKEPATLFGETDEERYQRLQVAEQNVHIEDETAGGQQSNIYLELAKEDKKKKKPAGLQEKKDKQQQAGAAGGGGGEGTAGEEGEPVDPQQQALLEQFKRAAEAVAEQQMAVEDRIAKYLRRWCEDWERDLEARPEEVKESLEGKQALVRFRESQEYFKPLFLRLKQRSLHPEMVAGLKLMVEAIRDRNYLHAYKIYMGIAVGNSPWPIGVTQVGLHERAAREKISFKGSQGQAHIMNDEVTRKFISALKRLMTFLQRAYPTHPSRSVDFDGGRSSGRGAIGGGSDKLALLEAMAKGDDTAPAPAPGWVDASGSVKVPEKWGTMLQRALQDVHHSDAREERQEQEERDQKHHAKQQQKQQQHQAKAMAAEASTQ